MSIISIRNIMDMNQLQASSEQWCKNETGSHEHNNILYIKTLMEYIETHGYSFLFDASDDPDVAINAMEQGFHHVLFTGAEEYYKKLLDLASKYDVTLLAKEEELDTLMPA